MIEKNDGSNDIQVPWEKIKERDEKYGVSSQVKKEKRAGIPDVDIHGDADGCWKKV